MSWPFQSGKILVTRTVEHSTQKNLTVVLSHCLITVREGNGYVMIHQVFNGVVDHCGHRPVSLEAMDVVRA